MTADKKSAPGDSATSVLLIEDNPGDAKLIREILAGGGRFRITGATRLEEGLALIPGSGVDLVLLDLNLPDSEGLDTLRRVLRAVPHVPVVVLTGLTDEDLGSQAVGLGAQDYLAKGGVNGPLLVRSLRYAMERHHLLAQLAEAREAAKRESELSSLERFARQGAAGVTARLFGFKPLREYNPSLFRNLVERYGALLQQAVEQQLYRVEHDISAPLRELADRIGFLGGGPRDVVEIHTQVLREKSAPLATDAAGALAEEGRILVLELMGYLASYYRSHCDFSRRPGPENNES